MECPNCHTMVTGRARACPRCGAALRDAIGADEGGAGIVEGTAERGPVSAELPLPVDDEQNGGRAHASIAGASSADTRLVVRATALPAVLWRQPAVRVAAQAGAGAIALTVGARLLRAWLARPRAVRGMATSALPFAADLLQSPSTMAGEHVRPERSGDVVETFIFLRRVVRRR